MSIRLPLTTILDYNDAGNVGASSVAGGVARTFNVPQDTDNVVVKLTASIIGGGVSATFQTSDDGGTTWYDVARSSVVSNANNTTAQWMSVPTTNPGQRTGVNQASSIITAGIGSAAASTLGSQQVSGLPLMGAINRIFLIYTAGVSGNDVARVQVKVNNQSATA